MTSCFIISSHSKIICFPAVPYVVLQKSTLKFLCVIVCGSDVWVVLGFTLHLIFALPSNKFRCCATADRDFFYYR